MQSTLIQISLPSDTQRLIQQGVSNVAIYGSNIHFIKSPLLEVSLPSNTERHIQKDVNNLNI